jgi:hypothetical protein
VGAFNVGEGPYLIKTDSLGNTVWQHVFRGGYRFRYRPLLLPVQQTVDGGYIIGTLQDTVLRLVKTDTAGVLQWQRSYPGLGLSEGMSLQQTQDSGYIVTGVATTSSPATNRGDVYLLKTNSAGDYCWKRTYGGPHTDNGWYVRQIADGGYVIAGVTDVTGAQYRGDGYVIRTDSTGATIQTWTIGDPDAADDARCVQQVADGRFVVTGRMGERADNQGYLYLRKLAPFGVK